MPDGGAGASARALELAYRYLNRRERTVHEVRQYLIGHDLDTSQVQVALAELVEAGHLDDARYAHVFTQDKRTLEQWGNGRIRRALLARGVERELIDDALGDDGGELDQTTLNELDQTTQDELSQTTRGDLGQPMGGELGRALAFLERRFPRPPGDRRERQRAMGVLVRRGYDPELASDAIAAYSRQTG